MSQCIFCSLFIFPTYLPRDLTWLWKRWTRTYPWRNESSKATVRDPVSPWPTWPTFPKAVFSAAPTIYPLCLPPQTIPHNHPITPITATPTQTYNLLPHWVPVHIHYHHHWHSIATLAIFASCLPTTILLSKPTLARWTCQSPSTLHHPPWWLHGCSITTSFTHYHGPTNLATNTQHVHPQSPHTLWHN